MSRFFLFRGRVSPQAGHEKGLEVQGLGTEALQVAQDVLHHLNQSSSGSSKACYGLLSYRSVENCQEKRPGMAENS